MHPGHHVAPQHAIRHRKETRCNLGWDDQWATTEISQQTACCNTPQHVAICHNMLQPAAACCGTPQHVAICHNMLQFATTCCNTQQHGAMNPQSNPFQQRMLQPSATSCDTSQRSPPGCIAGRCNEQRSALQAHRSGRCNIPACNCRARVRNPAYPTPTTWATRTSRASLKS